MPNDLTAAITAIVERLTTLAMQDAELRSQLRRLAQVFLESADGPPAETIAEERAAIPIADQALAIVEQLEAAISEESAEAAVRKSTSTPMPELTLGHSPAAEAARPVYPTPTETAEELGIIEARCRLKAEGSRWAATRRRLMAEGASFNTEIAPKDQEIIARAKELPNCFLWMCHSSGPSPSNLALYEKVAGCFEAVAEAVSVIKQIKDELEADQIEFEAALDLMAESQSALRVAISTIDGPVDVDQSEVFHWLRSIATDKQIFIRNYMRLDSPADPSKWPYILSNIEEVGLRVQEAKRRRIQRKKLLGKVRHKTTLILNDPDRAASEWETLIGTICELVEGGLPPSNRELRELLIPVAELLPERETLPLNFERVLVELDRHLAICPPPESPGVVKPTKEIVEAAHLLKGKALVLIGGEQRQGASLAIKAAFGLKELIWIETRAHESFESFGPYVARPDVAAVLLAIRWSSHSYGEVKNFCDTYGKPLVRLPGGYNPNQVAAQIMLQASDRLK